MDLETGTDHFFPSRDLWQPHFRRLAGCWKWTVSGRVFSVAVNRRRDLDRPEENLNTGFLHGNGKGLNLVGERLGGGVHIAHMIFQEHGQ